MELFLLFRLSIPSGYVVVFEKPMSSKFISMDIMCMLTLLSPICCHLWLRRVTLTGDWVLLSFTEPDQIALCDDLAARTRAAVAGDAEPLFE
jgi:hypothetical protein